MMSLADFDSKIPKTHFENGGFFNISDKKQRFWEIWRGTSKNEGCMMILVANRSQKSLGLRYSLLLYVLENSKNGEEEDAYYINFFIFNLIKF
jgi:hypothetical protein